MKILPDSLLGRLSVVCIISMPVFFFIGMSFVDFYESAGRTILEDIIVRPGIALPMLTGFLSGIAAFLTGIFGIRKKDHSILLFMSTAMGFLVLLWVTGEFFFLH